MATEDEDTTEKSVTCDECDDCGFITVDSMGCAPYQEPCGCELGDTLRRRKRDHARRSRAAMRKATGQAPTLDTGGWYSMIVAMLNDAKNAGAFITLRGNSGEEWVGRVELIDLASDCITLRYAKTDPQVTLLRASCIVAMTMDLTGDRDAKA